MGSGDTSQGLNRYSVRRLPRFLEVGVTTILAVPAPACCKCEATLLALSPFFFVFRGVGGSGIRTEKTSGAQGQNRTADTGIFSPLLYRLSYLGITDHNRPKKQDEYLGGRQRVKSCPPLCALPSWGAMVRSVK